MNNTKNMEYAEIELKHIQLELQNNRTQHLRHFVDQYYCYKNGFVNRNGRAHWEAIVWNDRVSAQASKLRNEMLSQGKPEKQALKEVRKLVVKEHVVPLKVITGYLRELAKNNNIHIDSIKRVLDKYTIFGTITKDEDADLRKAGLNSKMPTDEKGEEWDGKNLLARYNSVGIILE